MPVVDDATLIAVARHVWAASIIVHEPPAAAKRLALAGSSVAAAKKVFYC